MRGIPVVPRPHWYRNPITLMESVNLYKRDVQELFSKSTHVEEDTFFRRAAYRVHCMKLGSGGAGDEQRSWTHSMDGIIVPYQQHDHESLSKMEPAQRFLEAAHTFTEHISKGCEIFDQRKFLQRVPFRTSLDALVSYFEASISSYDRCRGSLYVRDQRQMGNVSFFERMSNAARASSQTVSDTEIPTLSIPNIVVDMPMARCGSRKPKPASNVFDLNSLEPLDLLRPEKTDKISRAETMPSDWGGSFSAEISETFFQVVHRKGIFKSRGSQTALPQELHDYTFVMYRYEDYAFKIGVASCSDSVLSYSATLCECVMRCSFL